VAGGVVLSDSATFSATLNGTDPDGYSQVTASGPVDLGGSTLNLTWASRRRRLHAPEQRRRADPGHVRRPGRRGGLRAGRPIVPDHVSWRSRRPQRGADARGVERTPPGGPRRMPARIHPYFWRTNDVSRTSRSQSARLSPPSGGPGSDSLTGAWRCRMLGVYLR
jgi:hypothetical protein